MLQVLVVFGVKKEAFTLIEIKEYVGHKPIELKEQSEKRMEKQHKKDTRKKDKKDKETES